MSVIRGLVLIGFIGGILCLSTVSGFAQSRAEIAKEVDKYIIDPCYRIHARTKGMTKNLTEDEAVELLKELHPDGRRKIINTILRHVKRKSLKQRKAVYRMARAKCRRLDEKEQSTELASVPNYEAEIDEHIIQPCKQYFTDEMHKTGADRYTTAVESEKFNKSIRNFLMNRIEDVFKKMKSSRTRRSMYKLSLGICKRSVDTTLKDIKNQKRN